MKGYRGKIQNHDCVIISFSYPDYIDRDERNKINDQLKDHYNGKSPLDLHIYALRHPDGDDSKPATLEDSVLINKWGLLFSKEPVEYASENGCLRLSKTNFTVDYDNIVNIEEFLEENAKG